MTQHSFFLTSGDIHLSATCFIPETVRGTLLFIPPLFEERKGALPVFVKTARALAKQQIASLIFDFSGCGDSNGDVAMVTTERLEADCEIAIAWLKEHFASQPLLVLGLRVGAVLASRLAARCPDIDLLVVWSPVTGEAFVQHLLQRHMINNMVAYGKAQTSRATLETTLSQGGAIDLDGYRMSSALFHGLQNLVPSAFQQPGCLFSGGHDLKTCHAFAALSHQVQCRETRYPPFWNTVGHVALDVLIQETCLWVTSQLAQSQTVVPPCPLQLAPAPLSNAEFITLESPSRVAGILNTPVHPPRAGVLFLHGWSGDRTGPHRLFSLFAHQLTAAGQLCLRFDFTGRGLSAGDPSTASITQMVADAEAGLLYLQTRLPPHAPIALVAICSGCKVAITLAAAHQQIDRILLWSPESMGSLRSASTGWRKTVNALRSYGRKLTRPDTWRKVLSGRVHTRLVAKALVNHETRSASEAAAEDQTLRAFRAFCHPLLMVFGGSDPDAPGSRRAYEHFCRRHGIPCEIHTIPHAGHSYYSEPWTETLFRISHPFLAP